MPGKANYARVRVLLVRASTYLLVLSYSPYTRTVRTYRTRTRTVSSSSLFSGKVLRRRLKKKKKTETVELLLPFVAVLAETAQTQTFPSPNKKSRLRITIPDAQPYYSTNNQLRAHNKCLPCEFRKQRTSTTPHINREGYDTCHDDDFKDDEERRGPQRVDGARWRLPARKRGV